MWSKVRNSLRPLLSGDSPEIMRRPLILEQCCPALSDIYLQGQGTRTALELMNVIKDAKVARIVFFKTDQLFKFTGIFSNLLLLYRHESCFNIQQNIEIEYMLSISRCFSFVLFLQVQVFPWLFAKAYALLSYLFLSYVSLYKYH